MTARKDSWGVRAVPLLKSTVELGQARELHPGGVHGGSDLDGCRASISGLCLQLSQGFYACDDGTCELAAPNGGDLDRWADANAALVGLFRRAVVFDSHTGV